MTDSDLGAPPRDGDPSQPEKQCFHLMCKIHDAALASVQQLRFDKKHPWHLHLVCLYGSMIELLGSACILIQRGSSIGVPILLRSLVEANLDLRLLAEDRTYGFRLRAEELQQWLLVYAPKGKRPVQPTGAGFDHMSIEGIQKELDDLRKQEYGPWTRKKKFEEVGDEVGYRVVYNHLCCHAHNNKRALFSRHVQVSDSGHDFQVQVYSGIDFERLLPYIDTFCGIMLKATEIIHELLGVKPLPEVAQLRSVLVGLRDVLVPQAAASLPEWMSDFLSGNNPAAD